MTIRAAVFDIGGVLERVNDAEWPSTWISRWEHRMGLPSGHVQMFLAENPPPGDATTGSLTEAQFRTTFAAALGLDANQAELLMEEMWDAYCGELDLLLRDFVVDLRPRMTTAILSNSADGARREEQRRYGFEQLVDVLIYSHEVGLAKPDPAIFRLTEKRLGAAPHEIVFLDDNQDAIATATQRGWHAILHRDTETSIREIGRVVAAAYSA